MKQKRKPMKCGNKPENYPKNRFLKDLISEYLVSLNNQDCDDPSTMCGDFEEAKGLYKDSVDFSKFLSVVVLIYLQEPLI